MKRILLIVGILMFLTINISKAQIVQSTTGYSTSRLKYFSYRGSLEVSIFTGTESGIQSRIVPLGLQVSPSLYFGLGVGSDFGDDISVFLTSKYNINSLSFGANKSFVPFAAAFLGMSCYIATPMAEIRVGLSVFSPSKRSGLSLFMGYQYAMNTTGYVDNHYLYSPINTINIGLNWEFGGNGAFNKRPRDASN